MAPTNPSSMPVSTADFSVSELPPPGGLCAIHQPNFFPRLTTLAKLFAADYWIVLDNVQFTRRDYQHRARLAALDDPQRHQWLSIPTHLPQGRCTTIRDARIADPAGSKRRVARMLTQYYSSSPHWLDLRPRLDAVLDRFDTSDRTADIAETSTGVLLDLLGWTGQTLRGSELPARHERSQRLADLAAATRAKTYLCGTGGTRYLQPEPFDAAGVSVHRFSTPTSGLWTYARDNSSLTTLMRDGSTHTAKALLAVAVQHRPAPHQR